MDLINNFMLLILLFLKIKYVNLIGPTNFKENNDV